ncbi:MAG: hypothetical protein ACRD96_27740 [Bryobacteraceae bacterium]
MRAAPNRTELSPEEAARIQKAHLAHLTALGEKRWLVGAGPITTPGSALRGILVSKCDWVEQANELASADPAVVNKRLVVESYGWTAPPGIGDRYWSEQAKTPKPPVKMQRHALALLTRSGKWTGWPAKELLQAHFGHAGALLAEGKVVSAGPFPASKTYLGAFVFAAGVPVDQARLLVEGDPLVAKGLAQAEVYEWMVAEGVFPEAK